MPPDKAPHEMVCLLQTRGGDSPGPGSRRVRYGCRPEVAEIAARGTKGDTKTIVAV